MGLDQLVLFRCSTAWVNFVGDDNCDVGWLEVAWCLCTWVGITTHTSHTTFLARVLGCTSCTLVTCQLWYWLPQYTAAWICRKSILSANAVVNALTTSRQWTPLSWHFWDMYRLRVGRDPVGITTHTSHTTFLARGLGCTSCTLVACQLWCWLPQYTAAWIWRKSILSANAAVNALTTSRQWTPLSWHFWDMYCLRVGRDPVAQTQLNTVI